MLTGSHLEELLLGERHHENALWLLISADQNACVDVEFWASLGTAFIITRKTYTLEGENSVSC